VTALGVMASTSMAQKSKVTVLNIDSKGLSFDPAQLGNLLRTEMDKLDTFEVMDKYDVDYVVDKNKLNITNCYGKLCLMEVAKVIGANKMMTGSAEMIGKTLIITLKMIDVRTESVEKTQIVEFLVLPDEIQNMFGITLAKMFHRPVNEIVYNRLTQKDNFDNATTVPNKNSLNLSGPRMGFGGFTGSMANVLKRSKENGGYDAFPVMFQFGYQFEQQYLNEGNFQALFEFIPMVTGLDQGKFFPSVTILNGLRSNVSGWEFAFGPTFNISSTAEGYYDANGNWKLKSDWNGATENPNPIIERMDSRGNVTLTSNFVVAVGKTFKSGKMNIPVNCFVIPSKEGFRFGISFGYNAVKNK